MSAGRSRRSIGVVVPVFRVERWIDACVTSIARQTRRPDQVVLVDDVGGDGSLERALAAAEREGLAVDVVRHEQNEGVSAARNHGLAALRTDLVWFCDADDTAEPELLERMVAALERHDVPMVMCRTARVDEEGRRLSIDEESFGSAELVAGTDLAGRLLRSEARGYACNKVVTRALAARHPFPEGQGYEDLAPVLAMMLDAPQVALVDEPLYRYLVNTGSLSLAFSTRLHDLFVQDETVAGLVRAAGLLEGPAALGWHDDLLRFRYDGVVLPVANMALRARTAARRDGRLDATTDATYGAAVAAARARVRAAEVRRLWTLGERRQAVAASVLRASPRLYEAILDRR